MMTIISFRTKLDKDEMLRKAMEMQRFADEFVECIENCEYEQDDRSYRDNIGRDEVRYRRMARDGRYSY